VAWETPVGVSDGDNKVFTATRAIAGEIVVVDHDIQIPGLDYTVAAGSASLVFNASAFPESHTPGAPPAGAKVRLYNGGGAVGGAIDVDICNRALLRCGSAVKIASLADNTKEARCCAAFYAADRDKLLALFDWSFARGHAALSLSADTARTMWGFVYDAPIDMLVPRRIWNGQRWSRPEDENAFDTEGSLTSPGATVILSDFGDGTPTTAELIYTRKITDASVLPSYFADVLAWYLAGELVLPLAVSPQASALMQGRFEKEFAIAVALDARKRKPDPRPESTFIAARAGRRQPFVKPNI
jgi:hypothetical protein